MAKIIINRRTVKINQPMVFSGTELTVTTNSTVEAGDIVYTVNGGTTHVARFTSGTKMYSVPFTTYSTYSDVDTYFCYCLDGGIAGSTIHVKVLN